MFRRYYPSPEADEKYYKVEREKYYSNLSRRKMWKNFAWCLFACGVSLVLYAVYYSLSNGLSSWNMSGHELWVNHTNEALTVMGLVFGGCGLVVLWAYIYEKKG